MKYWIRALGVGLITTATALLVYDRPPELALYWQPVLQGIIAAGAALGLNRVTRGR